MVGARHFAVHPPPAPTSPASPGVYVRRVFIFAQCRREIEAPTLSESEVKGAGERGPPWARRSRAFSLPTGPRPSLQSPGPPEAPSQQPAGDKGATSGKLRASESAFHCLPRASALCPLPVLKPPVPVVSSCMGFPFLWASLGESPFCRAGFSEE